MTQFFSTEPDLDPGPTPVADLEIVRNAYSIDESYLICTYFAKTISNSATFGSVPVSRELIRSIYPKITVDTGQN